MGVLLYEALTGHHPFDPKLPVEQLLVAILTVEPTDPRRLNPEAPASLSALTLRLLAKEPGQRPSSAREVREELERLRQEEGQTPSWKTPSGLIPEHSKPVDVAPERQSEHSNKTTTPTCAPTAIRPTTHWRKAALARALGLGLLGLVGWGLLHLESTAPASPVPLKPGAQPVQPRQTPEPLPSADVPVGASTRGCALLQVILGMSVTQFVGCATTPLVRPDPVGHLQRCSAEARVTPSKLGFHTTSPRPYLYASYIMEGTSASSQKSIEMGGPLNLKPGPIKVVVYPFGNGTFLNAEGVAVTTKMRVYIQFDRIQDFEGKWWPICGAAVSTAEDVYGIPTHEAVQWPDSPVDPAKVDHSPGSVVLNDPQFMTFIEPPEGARRAKVQVADPDAKADIEF